MSLYFNWKELEFYVDSIRLLISPSKIEQVIVPERKFSREGFIRGEWNFRLKSPKGFLHINFSIVPKRPTIAIFEERGPAAAPKATLSPFVQTLRKELTGAIIEDIQTLKNDRTLFLNLRQGEKRCRLFLFLFPNRPNAQLIVGGKIIADAQDPNFKPKPFKEPSVPKSAKKMGLRTDILSTPWGWGTYLQNEIIQRELENRRSNLSKSIKTKIKSIEQSIKKLEKTKGQAESEPDWNRFGDLLKANLHENLTPVKKSGKAFVKVRDYVTGKNVEIPFEEKLKPHKNVERFYRLANRHKKRIQETTLRSKDLNNQKRLKTEELRLVENAKGFGEILELEDRYLEDKRKKTPRKNWAGRTFESKDKFSILVGKSETENRSLTFHIARGKDVWIHLKNRPSAHVLIISKKNKTIPLETLLDAAHLCIYYTLGKTSEKIDVDYTFRKNVSSISKSTRVSYHSEKTLHVQLDSKRLARLLATE